MQERIGVSHLKRMIMMYKGALTLECDCVLNYFMSAKNEDEKFKRLKDYLVVQTVKANHHNLIFHRI